jgi:Rod binding domain-containing protein
MQPLDFSPISQPQAPAHEQPRLIRAAHEFEGQLMKELLKPLTESDSDSNSLTGDDDGSSSGSGGALGEFAAEALGRALSDRGGLGIADRIVGQLSHESNKNGADPVTAKVHCNTVVRIHQ